MDCKYLRSLIITKVVFIKHSSWSKMSSINHIVFEVTTKAPEQLLINRLLMLQQILHDCIANIQNYRKLCFSCFCVCNKRKYCHNFRPQPCTLLVLPMVIFWVAWPNKAELCRVTNCAKANHKFGFNTKPIYPTLSFFMRNFGHHNYECTVVIELAS